MTDEAKKSTSPKKTTRSKKQVELTARQRQTIVNRLLKIVSTAPAPLALRAALKLVAMDAKSQTLVSTKETDE